MREPRSRSREGAKGSLREERFRVPRRKLCKFCMDKIESIDFRETERLVKLTSERGKILPRRVSGACARHQRQLARAIKRARAIAFLPYIAE